MKLLKIIICTLLALNFLMTSVCFARGNDSINQALKKDSIDTAAEKAEVQDSINASFDQIESCYKNNYPYADIDKAKTCAVLRTFKVTMLNKSDFIKEYKSVNDFESIISNEYIWKSPIYNKSGEIIAVGTIAKGKSLEALNIKPGSIKKDDEDIIRSHAGKWFLVSTETTISNMWVKLLSNSESVSDLLVKNGINDPVTIKLVALPGFYTDMLYIKSHNAEYAVPFSSRDDWAGITSGNLYKMSDFIEILVTSDIYKEMNSDKSNISENLYGSDNAGVYELNQKNSMHLSAKNAMLFYICLGVLLLSFVLILFIAINKRKKRYA